MGVCVCVKSALICFDVMTVLEGAGSYFVFSFRLWVLIWWEEGCEGRDEKR